MSAREITATAMDEGYLDRGRLGGKTPHKTMQSKLSVHVRKFGSHSIFVNTGPGRYFLRQLLESPEDEYEVPPFAAGPAKERVLVFEQTTLDAVGRFQGIEPDWARYHERLTQSSACFSMDRMHAENTNSIKQIVTYILVRQRDGSLLCFDRGSINRVDEGLRGRSCVGFGGHLQSLEPSLFDVDGVALSRNAAKELDEELRLPRRDADRLHGRPEDHFRMLGVLNDDSSVNGLRHFAFVLEYVVSDDRAWKRPRGREKSINKVRWLTSASAERELVHHFEYWSQLCIRHFAPTLAEATPSFRVRRAARLKQAHVLVMAGQIASGKTEASRLLKEKCGFQEVNSGEVLASLLQVAPIPSTSRAEFQLAAEDFIRRPSGPRELAKALSLHIGKLSGRVLLDGVRHMATLEELKRQLGRSSVSVVYIHAPFDIALELYREREDPSVSALEFAELRSAPVELDVPRIIDVADAAIYNWRGLDAYAAVVRDFADEHLV